ncbi:MAG TPA: 30S ribosomal protein S5 [Oligoflexia bacterium]|nr:30S ribosomal protein S5 [Oligoflexia bacterium]HMP26482.1 30S ribosomal protein S5 [Oligoflexia bacterium]
MGWGNKNKFERSRVKVSEAGQLTDKTVSVRRVAKVVKGGRRFGFSALVVTGDGRGHFGFGLGKASEAPDAVKKASEAARNALIKIPIYGATIPHQVIGKFGPTEVVMRPAVPGTGVIAGSVVRAILEVAGVKDICTKCIGSSNPFNALYATVDGLLKLRMPAEIAAARGAQLEELNYKTF